MRAIGRIGAVLLLVGAAACEANYHEDLIQEASKLPPQDTLAGALAPAPSTATGGAAATPAKPGAEPFTGGVALTGTPPSQQGGGATGAAANPAATAGGAGAGGTTQPAAGGHLPTATVKK